MRKDACLALLLDIKSAHSEQICSLFMCHLYCTVGMVNPGIFSEMSVIYTNMIFIANICPKVPCLIPSPSSFKTYLSYNLRMAENVVSFLKFSNSCSPEKVTCQVLAHIPYEMCIGSFFHNYHNIYSRFYFFFLWTEENSPNSLLSLPRLPPLLSSSLLTPHS